VWTTTGDNGGSPGTCGDGGVWVHRLDGETGVVEDTIHLDQATFPCNGGFGGGFNGGLGPYGGAVDYEGNFWFHGFENFKLARIDFDTLDHEIFQGGGYGITVDTEARVWLSSSISRFDYDTEQWANQSVSTSGGIAQDLQGRIWAAGQTGVVWVDMETLVVGDEVALPGSGQVKGVSVDIDGYIWAIRQGDANAYKIHPDTYAIDTFTGLDGPYTYSDMTGGAINNVTCNPPRG
jgi:streptogramin lyase